MKPQTTGSWWWSHNKNKCHEVDIYVKKTANNTTVKVEILTLTIKIQSDVMFIPLILLVRWFDHQYQKVSFHKSNRVFEFGALEISCLHVFSLIIVCSCCLVIGHIKALLPSHCCCCVLIFKLNLYWHAVKLQACKIKACKIAEHEFLSLYIWTVKAQAAFSWLSGIHHCRFWLGNDKPFPV